MAMISSKSGYIKTISNFNELFNSSISFNSPSFLNKSPPLNNNSERSLPISKSVNRINYNHSTYSSLNDLTQMIEQCRINKVLCTNSYYDNVGYLSSRETRKNSNDLFNIKKDYLLTEVSKENYIQGVNRSSYKNSSRLKDKINEIIELSNSKVIKHPVPIKQDKDKTNSSNNCMNR